MYPPPATSRVHDFERACSVVFVLWLGAFLLLPWMQVVAVYMALGLALAVASPLHYAWIHRDPRVKETIAAAQRRFAADHPELQALDGTLRGDEPDRFVVAVIYRDPDALPSRGRPSYKLYSVGREDGRLQELPLRDDSPYLIRGVK